MSEDLSKRPKKDEEDDDDDDEDDDFDEEGNAEEEESAGWVDEKPPSKETDEDDEEDDANANNKKVESVAKNNTDSNAPLSSSSSSSSLSPAKALPDRLMPKQVGSVDEAVKTLLRPNSRPGSRLLVTVEFDQLSIDPDEVRKKLQEEREKIARNKQEGEGEGEGEAVEYTATELFQKLQALRPQDNKEGTGDASGSAGAVPPLNVANVGDSNKVESPRPVSPRAAELADMIEKAVEREQQELLRKKQEQEQQASEQTDEAEELVSPRKRKAGLKFWKKDKKDDKEKEKEKDKKDKKKVK